MNPDSSMLQTWWQAHMQGNRHARDQLITHYLYLVKYALGRILVHLPAHVDREDLNSYGLMGLIQSVDKFEWSRGIRFETFAAARIRGAILDHLRALDWMPRSLRQKAKEIEHTILRLEQSLGRPAEEAEIAENLGISVMQLHQTLSETALLVVSLDYLFHRDEANTELQIPDSALQPDEWAEQAGMREALQQALTSLPEREQRLVAFYYFEGLTLKEIGKILSLTEARVCQLHAQSIHRLRARLQLMMN